MPDRFAVFSLFSIPTFLAHNLGDLCPEIVTPNIATVSPTIASATGTNITVTGTQLQPGLNVTLTANGAVILQITILSFQISTTKRDGQQESFTFTTPSITGSADVSIVFTNPSGGSYTYPGFYITSDCSTPDMYGPAGTCLPCPASATCPGGDRLWPKPGYWNPDATVSTFHRFCYSYSFFLIY